MKLWKNKNGSISLYWALLLPMFLFLALLIFEAAIIIYAKQTGDRFMEAAAQAGMATARLVPQGVPQVSDNGNQVVSVKVDLSNIAIQLDRNLARRAVIDTLKKNITNAGWGSSLTTPNTNVNLDLSNVIAYSLASKRTDSIVFSKQLDRPRSSINDQDIFVVRGKIRVRAPLMATFYKIVFKGNLGIAQELDLPVEGKAQIRYRVGNNISNEFPAIQIP